jgi:hypothetical protein
MEHQIKIFMDKPEPQDTMSDHTASTIIAELDSVNLKPGMNLSPSSLGTTSNVFQVKWWSKLSPQREPEDSSLFDQPYFGSA